jgi:5-methylcytosine-specific restriction enzyme subunit McrC
VGCLMESTRIPIKNVYYMLCYAWNRLKEREFVHVSQEQDKDIYHLLTRVLITQLQSLIKRGFHREYTELTEESASLKGKLKFQESIRSLSFHRGKMVIQYEELSRDILHNRIIKTTLHSLLHVNELDAELKGQVGQLFDYFGEITVIPLNARMFNEVRLHRSNKHYGFVLDICKLLHDCLLMNEENSNLRFMDFERNHQEMAALFENFVRNFYRMECPGFKVSRENIYWDAEGELSLLPQMETDISIESDRFKIIMDTKFYHSAYSQRFDTEKLLSGNLYQMFAYLSNQRRIIADAKPTIGILLYPKVDKELNLSYKLKGHHLNVNTVDLNKNWQIIHNRLLEIVEI